jgi:hypothetical protein
MFLPETLFFNFYPSMRHFHKSAREGKLFRNICCFFLDIQLHFSYIQAPQRRILITSLWL